MRGSVTIGVACALAAIAIAGAIVAAGAASSEYDALCERIVELSKSAGASFTAGDTAAGNSAIADAQTAFKAAVALDPRHPQAYAHIGVLLLNAARFNESIDALMEGYTTIPESEKTARDKLSGLIRDAHYGYCSFNRDQVYQNGAGDVGKAYYWATRQLEFSRQPHVTHHEAGTLAGMLCEYDEAMCKNAERHLRIAFAVATSRYVAARMPPDARARHACMRAAHYVGSWAKHSKVTTQTVADGLFIHEIRGAQLVISGRDGVVTFPGDPADCSVLSPASDYHLNVAENLLPRGDQIIAPAKRISAGLTVLSGVQYHSASFYHWMCEVLPRLAVASLHWPRWREAVVLVPQLRGAKASFITDSMSMLFQDRVSLAEYFPFTEASNYAFVQWDAPTCQHPVGPCHALAHPTALAAAREELVRGLRRSPWAKLQFGVPVVVLALRGAGVTMRRYDEAALLAKLQAAVAARGSQVIAHDSSKMPFGQAIATYSRAAVVVGVHGGALANIMACAPGTAVIEVGFTTAVARHYAHVARALSLEYRLIEVKRDDLLRRSLGAPEIDFDMDAVVDAVLHAMPDAISARERYADEFAKNTSPDEDGRARAERRARDEADARELFRAGTEGGIGSGGGGARDRDAPSGVEVDGGSELADL
jgi:hypothetical protein